MKYEVIVGNVGKVTPDRCGPDEALAIYTAYVERSRSDVGKAAGETVTLLGDGEIIKEYTPVTGESEKPLVNEKYIPISAEELVTPLTPAGVEIVGQCDPRVKRRRAIEVAIVARLLSLLVDEGHEVIANNGEYKIRDVDHQEMIRHLFACDEASINTIKDNHRGWIELVFGNDGWDVVNDYTMGLTSPLDDFLDWVESERERLGD